VVLDGKDENPLIHDPVDHVVRKARYPSLSLLAAKGRARLRKFSDLLADLIDHADEAETKCFTALLV